jgi:hypothetical protein
MNSSLRRRLVSAALSVWSSPYSRRRDLWPVSGFATPRTQLSVALRGWPLLVQVTTFPASARLARDVPLST